MRRTIVSSKYRAGLVPLLTQEETLESVEHSISRMGTRWLMEAKLGKTIYSRVIINSARCLMQKLARDWSPLLLQMKKVC